MKKQKLVFNHLLRRYNKCLRKRKNLIEANRNERRQAILARHIKRLYEKLVSIKSFIQKGKVVTAVFVGALSFTNTESLAQNFSPFIPSPFSLTTTDLLRSTFGDLDGDGDFDMMAGDMQGNLIYQHNIGTPTSPLFDTVVTNPYSIIPVSFYCCANLAPELVDIDSDGDLDLFSPASYFSGEYLYFENVGTPSSPSFGPVQVNPFSLTCGFSEPGLGFSDVDGDGDYDMMANSFYGNYYYYENTGTSTSPVFAAPITNPFSLTDIGFRGNPFFYDFNSDGDLDLGTYEMYGDFFYYENAGTPFAPDYPSSVICPFNIPILTFNAVASLADIDGDGDPDLFANIGGSNIMYSENIDSTGLGVANNINEAQPDKVMIYDASGKFVAVKTDFNTKMILVPGEVTPGLYFIRYMYGNRPISKVQKIVIGK